jgi:hypothetical protein
MSCRGNIDLILFIIITLLKCLSDKILSLVERYIREYIQSNEQPIARHSFDREGILLQIRLIQLV